MSRIKSANTKPEIVLRQLLFKNGFRFRINGICSKKYAPNGRLPGKPDIILAKYKAVIFINGCFWHHHFGCKRASWPKSNRNYWIPKIKKNISRDKKNLRILNEMGWNAEVFWECEILNNKFDKRLGKLIKKMNSGFRI